MIYIYAIVIKLISKAIVTPIIKSIQALAICSVKFRLFLLVKKL